jgi:hypothetical protein
VKTLVMMWEIGLEPKLVIELETLLVIVLGVKSESSLEIPK